MGSTSGSRKPILRTGFGGVLPTCLKSIETPLLVFGEVGMTLTCSNHSFGVCWMESQTLGDQVAVALNGCETVIILKYQRPWKQTTGSVQLITNSWNALEARTPPQL